MAYKLTKRNNIDPIQPGCKKPVYYSEQEAQDMIKYIKETRVVREIRAYKCDVCGYWHLTSKSGPR